MSPRRGTWAAWVRRLGEEQRRLRRAVGLSEAEFARLAAVDCAVVQALEAGRAPAAPVPVMLKINLALRSLARARERGERGARCV